MTNCHPVNFLPFDPNFHYPLTFVCLLLSTISSLPLPFPILHPPLLFFLQFPKRPVPLPLLLGVLGNLAHQGCFVPSLVVLSGGGVPFPPEKNALSFSSLPCLCTAFPMPSPEQVFLGLCGSSSSEFQDSLFLWSQCFPSLTPP